MKAIKRALLLISMMLGVGALAHAQQQQWAAGYVDWSFPQAQPAEGIAQRVWIPQPAVASFFTVNFDFVGAQGGYIGLQSGEGGAGNVRFSLWNTTVARGEACRPFDGEGEGMTCVLPVAIQRDGLYRVRVVRGAADAQGQWWIGWLDEPNSASRQIGAIRTPRRQSEIAAEGIHNFAEFWGGAVRACRDVPLSAAAFAAPRLTLAGGEESAGAMANGTRPEENRCVTGRERLGAAVTHAPLVLQGAPAMIITLGGAPEDNAALTRRLAAEAPSR